MIKLKIQASFEFKHEKHTIADGGRTISFSRDPNHMRPMAMAKFSVGSKLSLINYLSIKTYK